MRLPDLCLARTVGSPSTIFRGRLRETRQAGPQEPQSLSSACARLARPAETGGPHSELQIGLTPLLCQNLWSFSVLEVREGPKAVVIQIGLADQKAESSLWVERRRPMPSHA